MTQPISEESHNNECKVVFITRRMVCMAWIAKMNERRVKKKSILEAARFAAGSKANDSALYIQKSVGSKRVDSL